MSSRQWLRNLAAASAGSSSASAEVPFVAAPIGGGQEDVPRVGSREFPCPQFIDTLPIHLQDSVAAFLAAHKKINCSTTHGAQRFGNLHTNPSNTNTITNDFHKIS